MTVTFKELRLTIGGGFRIVPAKHKVHQFAGGESHIEFGDITATRQVAFVQFGSNDDIMQLAMWADGIHRKAPESVLIAVLPYLPGARADRGEPLGAKVYADLVNSMGLDHVVCLDPHSDVAPALYNNLHIVPLAELFHRDSGFFNQYTSVIAPDAGARKRAEAVATELGVPVYHATKHRDFETRELSETQVPELNPGGRYLVVDDICDGGRTFIELAKAIDLGSESLSLWVTHGIFSYAALDRLGSVYGEIHTTDSHPGSGQKPIYEGYAVHPVFDFMLNYIERYI